MRLYTWVSKQTYYILRKPKNVFLVKRYPAMWCNPMQSSTWPVFKLILLMIFSLMRNWIQFVTPGSFCSCVIKFHTHGTYVTLYHPTWENSTNITGINSIVLVIILTDGDKRWWTVRAKRSPRGVETSSKMRGEDANGKKGEVSSQRGGKVAPTLGPVHDISNDQGKTGPHTRPSPRHF